MTIGAGTFVPAARFGFPRSYIYDFHVFRNGDTIVQSANTFVVTDATNPNLTATFRIDPRFFVWSSNSWTLDYVLIDSYYQNFPGDTPHPLPYNLIYKVEQDTGRSALYLGWSGFLVDPQRFPLPAQPSDYWLPKPLP